MRMAIFQFACGIQFQHRDDAVLLSPSRLSAGMRAALPEIILMHLLTIWFFLLRLGILSCCRRALYRKMEKPSWWSCAADIFCTLLHYWIDRGV